MTYPRSIRSFRPFARGQGSAVQGPVRTRFVALACSVSAVGLGALLAGCNPNDLPSGPGGAQGSASASASADASGPAATVAPPTSAAPSADSTTSASAKPSKSPGRTHSSAPTTKPSQTKPAPTGSPESGGNSIAAQIVDLVNQERAKQGLAALTVDAKLTKAADEHCDDMAAHHTMSHDGSDGSSPQDRIAHAGYNGWITGENVAWNQRSPQEVMTGWMNSPGHRANILRKEFRNIGACMTRASDGSMYWGQDFGAIDR